jgi:hypothetical protein
VAIPERDHAEFIGCERLIKYHNNQIISFRKWASAGDWNSFHLNHYDWWAFPIVARSSYGYMYSVSAESVSLLKADKEFLTELAEGAQLLLLSWGWDYKTNQPIENPSSGQSWANWPIRLYKCWKSMRLLGCEAEEKACYEYAQWLKRNGISFEYGGRDLYEKFVTGQS